MGAICEPFGSNLGAKVLTQACTSTGLVLPVVCLASEERRKVLTNPLVPTRVLTNPLVPKRVLTNPLVPKRVLTNPLVPKRVPKRV